MKCNNKAIHILNHGWEDIFSLYYSKQYCAIYTPQRQKANKQSKQTNKKWALLK